MTSFVSHLTIDCANAYELSEWWKPVLGYADVPDDPNEPGHEECMIVDPAGAGTTLLFIEVPEGKTVKNRLHLDLRPADRSQEEELGRLLEHGATLLEDLRGQYGPGTGWLVLADPAGNEFCLLLSREEKAALA